MNFARALVRLQTSEFLTLVPLTPSLELPLLRGSSSESLTEVLHHWDVIKRDRRLARTDDWADRYKVFWQQASAKLYDDIVSADSWGHLTADLSLAAYIRAEVGLLGISGSSERGECPWIVSLMKQGLSLSHKRLFLQGRGWATKRSVVFGKAVVFQ